MVVNATHPDYEAAAQRWSRARDVLAGEDAIKAAKPMARNFPAGLPLNRIPTAPRL
jgi:hypothetical protein